MYKNHNSLLQNLGVIDLFFLHNLGVFDLCYLSYLYFVRSITQKLLKILT